MFDPARVWAYRAATVPRLAHAVEPVEQSRPAPIPPAWVHPLSDFKSKRAELPARVRVGAPLSSSVNLTGLLLLPACAWVHRSLQSGSHCPIILPACVWVHQPAFQTRVSQILLPACAWVHLLIPHRVRNWTKRGFRQIFIHS